MKFAQAVLILSVLLAGSALAQMPAGGTNAPDVAAGGITAGMISTAVAVLAVAVAASSSDNASNPTSTSTSTTTTTTH